MKLVDFVRPIATFVAIGLATGATAQDSGGSEQYALEEIVVQAQKRAQSLNDVGIAITAFDERAIEDFGFKQAADVAGQTPNFTVATLGFNTPNFTIRGVGVNDYTINLGTSVGTYVDEIFIVSPAMMLFQMFDTQRVEVLKGPQGTLYGRNTTGGAVLFTSNRPTEEFDARLKLRAGNFGYTEFEGAIGGPLSDTLTARLALNATQSDGFQRNSITGNKHGAIDRQFWRLIFDWRPTDTVDFLLNIHGGTDQSELQSYNQAGVGGPEESTGTIDSADGIPFRDNDHRGISLIANADIGALTLTSVSGYDELDRYEHGDGDGLPSDAVIDQEMVSDLKQFTQELRLAPGNSGELNWVAGLYYSRDEIEDFTDFPVTGLGIPNAAFGIVSSFAALDALGNQFHQISTSKAAFGQIEWELGEQWRLTTGLRYSNEKKEFNNVSTRWTSEPGAGESGPTESGLLFPAADYSETFGAVSGKLALDYLLSDDALAYASVSRGFKSGGFQGTLVFDPSEIVPIDEEFVTAFEVGGKFTLASGRVQLNTAAFWYDYESLQAQGTLVDPGGGVGNLFALQNVGDAEVFGFEAELQALPVEGLLLSLGVGHLNAEITKPFIAEVRAGGKPALSPDWNINANARYEFDVGTDKYMFLQADLSYQDKVFLDIYESPSMLENAYTLINARVGIANVDDRWSLSIRGRNLSDTEYRASAFTGGLAGDTDLWGMPRSYSVEFDMRFQGL